MSKLMDNLSREKYSLAYVGSIFMRLCILSLFLQRLIKSKYLRIWSIWSIRIDSAVAWRINAHRWVSMRVGIRYTPSKLLDSCHFGLAIGNRQQEAQQMGSMKTPSVCYQHWEALLVRACSFSHVGRSITTNQQTHQKNKNPTFVSIRQENGFLTALQIRKIPSLPSTRAARANAMNHFLLWKNYVQGRKVQLSTRTASNFYRRGILVEVSTLDREDLLSISSKNHRIIPWLSCRLLKNWYIDPLTKWTLISSSKVRLLAETLKLTTFRLSSSGTTNQLNKRYQSTSYLRSKAQIPHFTSFQSHKKWSKRINGQLHSPISSKAARRWTQASLKDKTHAVISKTSVCSDWIRSANKWSWV